MMGTHRYDEAQLSRGEELMVLKDMVIARPESDPIHHWAKRRLRKLKEIEDGQGEEAGSIPDAQAVNSIRAAYSRMRYPPNPLGHFIRQGWPKERYDRAVAELDAAGDGPRGGEPCPTTSSNASDADVNP